ncbi:MAG: Triacylglycerol lipase precursor [Myxococcales bacterium]|nr:Triacylglycerol lipase precursor [Myxococcales bacterium]
MRILRTLSWALLVLGCSNSPATSPPDMAMLPPPPPPALLQACTDAIADVYTLPAGLPAYDSTHRGDVIRCAYDKYLSAAEINKQMSAYGYTGATLPSGAWLFRIAYRTERIAAAGGTAVPEGTSSGILLVPDHPRAGGPLVVFAHASVGIAPPCAPSQLDLVAAVAGDDHRGAVLGLAGYGWLLMVPDYAGFGYGDAPGWSLAEDEAHGVLDSTRAAKQLVPALPSQVVFVGHSQGGHAALSAQSYAKSYGMQGELIGVAAYAPLWLSAYAWAGIIDPLAMFKTSDSGYAIMYTLDYFYSHGEVYDGPGGGLAMIQPAKRDAVRSFLMGQCSPNPPPGVDISTLGAAPSDFFEPSFISSIGGCGTGFGSCDDATAMTWTARFVADRPHIDPSGPPVLIFDGGKDSNFPPARAQCMFDKIAADLALTPSPTTTIRTCFDADAQHFDIMRRDVDYANQWIAARAGIGPEPMACAPFPTGLTCQTPPPNL